MNRRQVHAIRERSQAYRSGVQYGKQGFAVVHRRSVDVEENLA